MPDGMSATSAALPAPLMARIDEHFPGYGECAFCGDCILGARHRVMDAIAERFVAGEDIDELADDYGVPVEAVAVAIAGSYEHDKAIKKAKRRAREARRNVH